MIRIAVLCCCLSLLAATDAIGPDSWPCWRGDGSGTVCDDGRELVTDPKQVEKLWTSEVQNIPYTWPRHGGNGFTGEFICGGYGSPVVVAGRVYIAWWEPSGDKIDRAALEKAQDKREDKWRAAADEILTCIDARDGTTLWQTRMEGTGWNQQYNNHNAIYQPVVVEGVVVLNGNAGWVHCLEVESGDLKWQARLGPVTDIPEAYKARGYIDPGPHRKNAKGLPRWNKYLMNVSPAIADGVVACNDQSGNKERGHALVGFDLKTGEERWRVPGCLPDLGSPLVWNHDGKRYFIAVGPPRAVCVEPATGRVLWEIEPPAADHDPLQEGEKKYPSEGRYGKPKLHIDGTPALAGDVLVVGANRAKPHGGNVHVEPWHVGHSAWRISPEGAELLWRKTRREFRATHASPVIHRGRVYISSVLEGYQCLDLETGEELATAKRGNNLITPVAGDGRIFCAGTMYRADPAGFAGKSVKLPVSTAMYTHSFYTDGLLFTRGLIDGAKRGPKMAGAVHCYDLRR